MAEHGPIRRRNEGHEVRFDFFSVHVLREAEAIGQARHMRVHDDSDIRVERISENYICSFAAYAAKLSQFFHRARYFTLVFIHNHRAASFNVPRLVSIKAGSLDVLLQFGEVGLCVVFCGAAFLEEISRDNVHAFVGALSRKNRSDEQFERIGKIQLAMCVRIGLLQSGDDFFNAGGFGFGGFAWHITLDSATPN